MEVIFGLRAGKQARRKDAGGIICQVPTMLVGGGKVERVTTAVSERAYKHGILYTFQHSFCGEFDFFFWKEAKLCATFVGTSVSGCADRPLFIANSTDRESQRGGGRKRREREQTKKSKDFFFVGRKDGRPNELTYCLENKKKERKSCFSPLPLLSQTPSNIWRKTDRENIREVEVRVLQ